MDRECLNLFLWEILKSRSEFSVEEKERERERMGKAQHTYLVAFEFACAPFDLDISFEAIVLFCVEADLG